MNVIKTKLNTCSYHRSVNVGRVQLQVNHAIDGGLAILMVVLTDLGIHFCWFFVKFSKQINRTKIEYLVSRYMSGFK